MAEPADHQFDHTALIGQEIKLLKERNLPKMLNEDLVLFQDHFRAIKTLLLQPANNENFEKAYEHFYHIFDVVPMMYNRLSDVPIFRAARNRINEVFSTQKRISYHPDPSQVGPGKFNVWYQSMFYGCLPYRPQDEDKYPPPRLVAALECCKDLYKRENPLLVQDITIGRWHIHEPFDAINLCFDIVHLHRNPELKAVNELFMQHMRDAYSPKAAKFIKEIYEFFSILCRKGSDEKAYYVLTALFAALKIYHKFNNDVNIEALISASAASEGHGLNIVMFPETVDRCLRLHMVVMDRFFLVKPEMQTYVTYSCSEIVTNYDDAKDFDFKFGKLLTVSADYIRNQNFTNYGYRKNKIEAGCQ